LLNEYLNSILPPNRTQFSKEKILNEFNKFFLLNKKKKKKKSSVAVGISLTVGDAAVECPLTQLLFLRLMLDLGPILFLVVPLKN